MGFNPVPLLGPESQRLNAAPAKIENHGTLRRASLDET